MGELYGIPLAFLFVGLFGLWLLLFIYILTVSSRIKKMKKRYRAMMGPGRATQLEEVLIELQNKADTILTKMVEHESRIVRLSDKISQMQGKIGLIRYNAFSQHGSDLSFSLALLNEQKDGVVITGIHNREDTCIYAKPVERGQSTYTLTPEEKQVISQTSATIG